MLFCPDYTNFPHRTKICSAIIETWNKIFHDLKADLIVRSVYGPTCLKDVNVMPKGAAGVPSFTTDMWSSKNRDSYLCITAHWLVYVKKDLQEGLQLRSAVIAFHRFVGHHTGVNIANTILQLLAQVGIPKLTQANI